MEQLLCSWRRCRCGKGRDVVAAVVVVVFVGVVVAMGGSSNSGVLW